MHRADELRDRIWMRAEVTKPIIHLSASEPMVVDIQALIAKGRPWFVYSKPDDLAVAQGLLVGRLRSWRMMNPPDPYPAELYNPSGEILDKLYERYPWRTGLRMDLNDEKSELRDIGPRWHSLIVSPSNQPWMVPPPVPADPRYAWWKRLRDVECSWVSSRGEAERFLFYDGPTLVTAPMRASMDEEHIRLADLAVPILPTEYLRSRTQGAQAFTQRTGIILHVRPDTIAGSFFNIEQHGHVAPLASLPLRGPGVEQRFRQLLLDTGLSASEADGFMDAWRKHLFEAPGLRFLLLMSPADYDALCPLQVRPAPTELVRTGFILWDRLDQHDPR